MAPAQYHLAEQHSTCIQQTVYYMRCLTLENILYALIFYGLGNQLSSKHFLVQYNCNTQQPCNILGLTLFTSLR